MIAIPNMDKPQTCHECRLHSYDWGNGYVPSHDVCHPLRKGFNSRQFDGDRQVDIFHEVHPDCPLIDIVECWECEYYNGHEEYCDNDYFAREYGFCHSGKRRTDADPHIQSIEQEEWYNWRDEQEYEDRWGRGE